MNFKSYIRTVPDYPQSGIQFRDITTLFKDAAAFNAMIDALELHYGNAALNKVVGIEARGLIVGAAVAGRLGLGFVPARKPGKLPSTIVNQTYTLEYGHDSLEMHTDAIVPGEKILLLDDLIATGGTALAAVGLIRKLGGLVEQAGFVVDLPELGGMQRLLAEGIQPFALCQFEGH